MTHPYDYLQAFNLLLALRQEHVDLSRPEPVLDRASWTREAEGLARHLKLGSVKSRQVKGWMMGNVRFPEEHWEGLIAYCQARLGEEMVHRVMTEGWPLNGRVYRNSPQKTPVETENFDDEGDED